MLDAIYITLAVTFGSHLGLCDAIATRIKWMGKTIAKIIRCPKCLTFWSVLIILTIDRMPFVASVMVSLLCSYSSQWLILLLEMLYIKYIEIWQKKINQK